MVGFLILDVREDGGNAAWARLRERRVSHLPSTLPLAGSQGKTALRIPCEVSSLCRAYGAWGPCCGHSQRFRAGLTYAAPTALVSFGDRRRGVGAEVWERSQRYSRVLWRSMCRTSLRALPQAGSQGEAAVFGGEDDGENVLGGPEE